MAIVKLETGEELEFDNSYSDEQISQAVEEYLSQQKPKSDLDNLRQQTNQEDSRLKTVGKGIVSGAENLGLGIYQAVADLGADFTGAKKALSLIRPDLKEELSSMTSKDISESLAGRYRQKEIEEKDKGLLFKIARGGTELLPYLTTGAGIGSNVSAKFGSKFAGNLAGSAVGAGIGGATQEFLSPQEQSGLENRAIETAKSGAIGAGLGAGLGAGGYLLGKGKEGSKYLYNRLASEMGNEKASVKIAANQLRKGFENEGLEAGKVLKEIEGTNKYIADILDPRLATLNKALKNLDTPQNIKIADEAVESIDKTTNALQDRLLNLVSKNKITPEQAGEILGRNSKEIFDKAIKARSLTAGKLYDSALQKGGRINVKKTLEDGTKLGDMLKSDFMQKVIANVRRNSKEFAGTPASK